METNAKQHKAKKSAHSKLSKRRNPLNFFFYGLFLGFVVFLSASCGAALALILSGSPLRHHSSSHLPQSADRLTGLIPATLERPINLLILGIDNSGIANLDDFSRVQALNGNSDTMLLLRLYPDTHQINVLSIPRDTQVQIEGKLDKINDANMKGGAILAAQTVSQLLGGITIDRYLRVDTKGFIDLVDAIDGVKVNVPKKMDYVDETQHLNIHFLPGEQVLNGQHLQEYVRFRHDELGDIGRVQRQQEVLKALESQLIQPATLSKLPKILEVAKTNVDTDLSIEEMLAIGRVLAQTDRQHVNLILLPGRFSRPEEYRLSYWIANPQKTAPILANYFDLPSYSQGFQNDSNPHSVAIAVANNTSKAGLAAKTVALLKSQGFPNAYVIHHKIASSSSSETQTQMIAQHGNPQDANLIKNALGIGQVQVSSTGDLYSDVTVIVGSDLAAKVSH